LQAAELLDLVGQAAGLGTWEWDLATNRMFYSDRARAICGFGDQSLTLQMVRDVTHPEDLPRTSAMAAAALDPARREKAPYEYRVVRADGCVRWVRAHGAAVFEQQDGETRAVRYVGTIQDITDRKKTEQALLESEARLRLALDAGRLAVWEYDVATDTVKGSPELYRLLGFPEGATPSMSELREGYHPEDQGVAAKAGREAFEKGERFFEAEYRYCVGGQLRWLHLRGEILTDPSGIPLSVIGVVGDITRPKESQLQLADTLSRLVASLEASGTGTWRWDVKNDQVTWDDALCQVYRLSRDKAPRTSSDFFKLVHPEDMTRVSEIVGRAFSEGVDPDYEFRTILEDGSVRWIYDRSRVIKDSSGEIVAIIGACLDVTDRKLSETKLIESEERLRRAHEAAQIGDWELDLVTGKVIWSENLYRLVGLSSEDFAVSERAKLDLIHPEDRHRVESEFARVGRSNLRIDVEFRARHSDGGYRWLASRGELQFDSSGQPARIVGVNFDITALRQAHAQQRLLINELNHRVKNTLATVQSLATMTFKKQGADDLCEAFMGRLLALSATHNLLTASMWEGAFIPDIVREELRPYAGGQIAVLSDSKIFLEPNVALNVGLVIHELATNAVKHGALSLPEGRLEVSWDGSEAMSKLLLTWKEASERQVRRSSRRGFGSRLIEATVKNSTVHLTTTTRRQG
jgi:PAS domain S-box-containing protein